MDKSAQTSNPPTDIDRQPGKPTHGASSFEHADKSADELIRALMLEQKRDTSHETLPRHAPVAETPGTKRVKHPRRLFKLRMSSAKPAEAVEVQETRSKPKGKSGIPKPIRALLTRIAGYRPTRKHLFFLTLAIIFYLSPWLIPITVFVIFLTVLIGYFSLGPDRVAELVVGAWQRLHARRPELAETLRQRAEDMAVRVDAWLDRMPGEWTESVHVPDFAKPDEDDGNRPDPFERLAKEAQHG